MKNQISRIMIVFLVGVLVPLMSGCAAFLPDCFFEDVHVAYYEVTTEAAKQIAFKEEINKLGQDLAKELGWEYVQGPEFSKELLFGQFKQSTCVCAFIEWEAQSGNFSIGWRGLPPTDPEFQKLRDHFEKVLNKSYASKWKFYYQKKSYVLV